MISGASSQSPSIHALKVGMSVSIEKTFTDADVWAFAKLSGDINPVHLNEEYAQKSRYKKRILHGMLSTSLFSGLFGAKIPGYGCVYAAQNLIFRRPVYLGDAITATVEITKIELELSRVFFRTYCTVKGRLVIDGEALIFIP